MAIFLASLFLCVSRLQIRVMTNNPAKYSGLEGYGLTIVERVPVQISPNPENFQYLRTKQQKMGHWLDMTAEGRAQQDRAVAPSERE